jgi:hypothetical protein
VLSPFQEIDILAANPDNCEPNLHTDKMKSRIENVPKLKTERMLIDGARYNQVRLGLLRLDNPLRLRLSGLRGMDIIMDNTAWVCVDRTMYDLPVLAWTNFETSERNGLHEPVCCQLHFYHIHADLIIETVLATMTAVLTQLLNSKFPGKTKEVSNLAIPRKKIEKL